MAISSAPGSTNFKGYRPYYTPSVTDWKSDEWGLIEFAKQGSSLTIKEEVLPYKPDTDYCSAAIEAALAENHWKVVMVLVKYLAETNHHQFKPFANAMMHAVRGGLISQVEELLTFGGSFLPMECAQAIDEAILINRNDIVGALLLNREIPNHRRVQAALEAARKGFLSISLTLLRGHSVLDIVGNQQRPKLMQALWDEQRDEAVKILEPVAARLKAEHHGYLMRVYGSGGS